MKIVPILAIKKIKNSHSYQSSSPSPYSTSCQTLRSHSTKIIYCGSTKFNPPLSLSWNYSNDTRHSGKFKSATPSPESLPTSHAFWLGLPNIYFGHSKDDPSVYQNKPAAFVPNINNTRICFEISLKSTFNKLNGKLSLLGVLLCT